MVGIRVLEDGRGRWLSDLYEANSTAVFRVCQRLLQNRDDAADATHEVFLRAIASLPGEPSGDRARAWLITVAHHHCLDVLRRQKRLRSALHTLASDAERDGQAEQAVVDRQFVDAILRQLRDRERQALWQSAVEHRPVAEIATYLGLSYMAAAQLLHRARQRASLVAAKLAAILGLLELDRLWRRARLGAEAHPLSVAVVMPLVVAGLVAASSPRQGENPVPAAVPGRVAVQSPANGANAKSPSGSTTAAAVAASAHGGLWETLPSLLPQPEPSTASAVTGAVPLIDQLTGNAVPAPTPGGLIP
jgi:RNA polymerase sigma factor (sigma-70 family)